MRFCLIVVRIDLDNWKYWTTLFKSPRTRATSAASIAISVPVAKAIPKEQVIYCPGVCTPSEAFSALALGADLLKLFPAEVITPQAVRALRSVLPTKTLLAPVGGITSSNIPEYIRAGAAAFGIGSSLYTPTTSLREIRKNARALINAFLLSKR